VRQIYDHTDPELAVEWVDEIGRDLTDREMPVEVRGLGLTITRWSPQICAWHRSHVSNGPTEAVNNLAKRIKRVAFGLTNFRHHRVRCLLYASRPDWTLLPTIQPDADDPAQRSNVVTIPLAPRTARAIDLAVGERCEGPIFVGVDGGRIDRHAAGRIVRRVARRAGIAKPVGPHTLRHAFITAALDAGVPLRDVQEAVSHADPRTTMRYDRARVSLERHATYIVATFLAGASR
jgi:hypothetical protein